MEPSLTDYARFYGLTTNYLELDPLAGLPSHEAAHAELDDEPELFRIDDEAEANPLEERLAIDRDTILLLGSNTKDLKHESSFEELGLDPHRIRKLKLELPMLRTDHESDMQDFARKVKPDLANEHLPLELLHEEADEGLGWPPDLHALPDVLLDKCKAEKLDISLGLLDYMRIALNLDSAVVEQPSFELEEVPRKKVNLMPSQFICVSNLSKATRKKPLSLSRRLCYHYHHLLYRTNRRRIPVASSFYLIRLVPPHRNWRKLIGKCS